MGVPSLSASVLSAMWVLLLLLLALACLAPGGTDQNGAWLELAAGLPITITKFPPGNLPHAYTQTPPRQFLQKAPSRPNLCHTCWAPNYPRRVF